MSPEALHDDSPDDPQQAPEHAALMASIDRLEELVFGFVMGCGLKTENEAVQRGLMHRLKIEGLRNENASVGYLTQSNIEPSFPIKFGDTDVIYYCRRRLICLPAAGLRLNINELTEGTSLQTVNPELAGKIAETLTAGTRLIENNILERKQLLTSASETPDDAREILSQKLLELDAAVCGLKFFLASDDLRPRYLSDAEEDQRALEFSPSSYECRPQMVLASISDALAEMNRHDLKIGRRLAVPIGTALDALAEDLKIKTPVTITGQFVRQRIVDILSRHGIDLRRNSKFSLHNLEQTWIKLQTIRQSLEQIEDFDLRQFVSDPYLDALIRVAEPEWSRPPVPETDTAG